jgi:hypothetical protein
MKTKKKTNRRVFFNRILAFSLGGISAAAGIVAALKGSKMDPFLPLDSAAVLKRFGNGSELLSDLKLPYSTQKKYAIRIVGLKIKFAKNPSAFKNRDFNQLLKKAISEDYKKEKVMLVQNWLLSETEVAIFIYNHIRRYQLIK